MDTRERGPQGPGLGHSANGAVRPKTGWRVVGWRRRTPGRWHPARDAFSAQLPCQAQRKSPGPRPWPGAIGRPGGPPCSPAARLPCPPPDAASLPPASAAGFLPPPAPVCFSSRTIASHGGGHPGRRCSETSLCPRRPGGDGVGGRVSSALAPGPAGGIQSMRESSPRLCGLERGSGSPSACLGPSPCSSRAPSTPRIGPEPWQGTVAGQATRGSRGPVPLPLPELHPSCPFSAFI